MRRRLIDCRRGKVRLEECFRGAAGDQQKKGEKGTEAEARRSDGSFDVTKLCDMEIEFREHSEGLSGFEADLFRARCGDCQKGAGSGKNFF
jgi:hypothetical protein